MGYLPARTNTIQVTSSIGGVATWYATNEYVLNGQIYVLSNAVLNIEAGTVVRGKPGDTNNYSALFVTRNGKLLVNELAPRPHNSGHHTIDACVTNQFQQQLRTVAGLPPGDPRQHTPAVMVNLLGDLWPAPERHPDWSSVLTHPRAFLHLYGKRIAKPGRKMGHFTVLGETVEHALADAMNLRRSLGMES